MTPKTERFEMRVESTLLERVDAWRGRQDDLPSRAEAIRRLLEVGMAEPEQRSFHPTNPEKLMLWLLTEILKGQKGHDKKAVEIIQEAIYGGHFWAMDWELSGILHNHVDRKESVDLVAEALDMWWFIEDAYKGFSADEKKEIEAAVGPLGKDPKFAGFDGNSKEECECIGIARLLTEKMDRFTFFKGRDFNSHYPSAERYQRMIAKFKPMLGSLTGRGGKLGVKEVIALLKA
jgi:uncharacterized protein